MRKAATTAAASTKSQLITPSGTIVGGTGGPVEGEQDKGGKGKEADDDNDDEGTDGEGDDEEEVEGHNAHSDCTCMRATDLTDGRVC